MSYANLCPYCKRPIMEAVCTHLDSCGAFGEWLADIPWVMDKREVVRMASEGKIDVLYEEGEWLVVLERDRLMKVRLT